MIIIIVRKNSKNKTGILLVVGGWWGWWERGNRGKERESEKRDRETKTQVGNRDKPEGDKDIENQRKRQRKKSSPWWRWSKRGSSEIILKKAAIEEKQKKINKNIEFYLFFFFWTFAAFFAWVSICPHPPPPPKICIAFPSLASSNNTLFTSCRKESYFLAPFCPFCMVIQSLYQCFPTHILFFAFLLLTLDTKKVACWWGYPIIFLFSLSPRHWLVFSFLNLIEIHSFC